jgi:hypothetical protein
VRPSLPDKSSLGWQCSDQCDDHKQLADCPLRLLQLSVLSLMVLGFVIQESVTLKFVPEVIRPRIRSTAVDNSALTIPSESSSGHLTRPPHDVS